MTDENQDSTNPINPGLEAPGKCSWNPIYIHLSCCQDMTLLFNHPTDLKSNSHHFGFTYIMILCNSKNSWMPLILHQ